MNRGRKAIVVGGGGTLVWYAVLLVLAWASSHFNSDAGLKIMIGLSLPLFPGMIPGGLFSVLLSVLGINGFGFHDIGFAVCSLISAPVVNSYLTYLWIKRRSPNRV